MLTHVTNSIRDLHRQTSVCGRFNTPYSETNSNYSQYIANGKNNMAKKLQQVIYVFISLSYVATV